MPQMKDGPPERAPRISLPRFLDFVARGGGPRNSPKMNCGGRPPDIRYADFYGRFRQRLVTMHRKGEPVAVLYRLAKESPPQKRRGYLDLAIAHARWCAGRSFRWFQPPRITMPCPGASLTVNPELGLFINGHPHLIKLYFKKEELIPAGVKLVCRVLRNVCEAVAPTGCSMGVLDLRRSALLVHDAVDPELDRLLAEKLAELATLAAVS